MKLFKKAKKGFTLVELVVVIAVIAILAAVSVGAYFGVTESAKNSQVEQEAKAVHTSITLVANDPKYKTSMDEDGITVDATFEASLQEVTGLNYNVMVGDTAQTVTGETEEVDFPKIVFSATSTDKFTYYIDDGHYAEYNVVTGEKLSQNGQAIVK